MDGFKKVFDGCRAFGNQRYVNLSRCIDNVQTHNWLKAIIKTVQWDTDDVQSLHNILVTLCNRSKQFKIFLPSELEPILGVLLPTSRIQAWKVVFKMCQLMKLYTVYDNQMLANCVAQAPETDIDQEWFSYASSILLQLRLLSAQPSQGFTDERYKIILRCHNNMYIQERQNMFPVGFL